MMTRMFGGHAARFAVIGTTVLLVAGCAGESSASDAPASADTIAPPSSSASSSAGACPESESQGPWGDVIAAEQVTDAAGSYCHTALDPAAAAATFNPAVVDLASLTTHGFTIEDAEAAHQVAVAYVAEQGLDSSRLDEYSVPDSAWFDAARTAFTAAAQAHLAPAVARFGLRDTGVIVTQSLPSPLPRTGGPRATHTEVDVDRIFATLDEDQVTPLLLVRVPIRAEYAAPDEAIVDAAIRDERGTSNLTAESLTASAPTLFDGADDEGLVVSGSFTVGFGVGDRAAIAYVSAAWLLGTGDNRVQVDLVEPEVNPDLR
jgi:hypothetical protein